MWVKGGSGWESFDVTQELHVLLLGNTTEPTKEGLMGCACYEHLGDIDSVHKDPSGWDHAKTFGSFGVWWWPSQIQTDSKSRFEVVWCLQWWYKSWTSFAIMQVQSICKDIWFLNEGWDWWHSVGQVKNYHVPNVLGNGCLFDNIQFSPRFSSSFNPFPFRFMWINASGIIHEVITAS